MSFENQPQSTRRQFLQGRAAAEAFVAVTEGLAAADAASFVPPSVTPRGGAFLLEVGRPAMACQFEVLLNEGQYTHAAETAVAALDLVELLENQLTVYQPQSEVMRLNATASAGPVPVEANLFALFEQAIELCAATGGAFDITAGPLTKTWGFYRREGRIPNASELAAARACVGSQHLRLNRENHAVAFARPGMEINLGAIGKGYALDRGAALLQAAGVHDFLFHGGLSSVCARGARMGTTNEKPGWIVGLRHPLNPQRRLAEFRLHNAALGTSGTGAQFFQYQGRRYGHILDPRTGQPAQGLLSATVIAPTAALADALSTAFFVLGVEASLAWCQQHSELNLGLVLTTAGPQAGSIQLHAHGLAENDWRPLTTE